MEDVLKYILVAIGLFLLLREVNCWYWKINASLSVQEKILRQLERLISRVDHMQESSHVQIEENNQFLKSSQMVNPEAPKPIPQPGLYPQPDPTPKPEPSPQPDPTPKPEAKPKKPKKPYCPRCNEKNTFGEYCKFCGAKLEDADEE